MLNLNDMTVTELKARLAEEHNIAAPSKATKSDLVSELQRLTSEPSGASYLEAVLAHAKSKSDMWAVYLNWTEENQVAAIGAARSTDGAIRRAWKVVKPHYDAAKRTS